MKSIRLFRIGNIGELQRVVLIDVNDVLRLDVDALQDVTGHLHATALSLKPTAEPVSVYFKPGGGNLREVGLKDGTIETYVKFDALGDWAEMGRFRNWVRGRRLIVVTEDTNGTVRLFGNVKQPLRADVNYDSQKRINAFVLSAVLPAAGYYLDAIDEAAWMGSTSGFSIGFNFGFR